MEIGLGASVPGVHFPSETTSDEFANDLLNYSRDTMNYCNDQPLSADFTCNSRSHCRTIRIDSCQSTKCQWSCFFFRIACLLRIATRQKPFGCHRTKNGKAKQVTSQPTQTVLVEELMYKYKYIICMFDLRLKSNHREKVVCLHHETMWPS